MSETSNRQYPDWLSSTLASDAVDGRGVLPRGLHPLSSKSRVVGLAFVVLASQNDNQVIRRMVENPPLPGFVLMVGGHQASSTATVGGLIALELQKIGFLAIITEGLVRDSQEIRQLNMPVWCRGVTPAASAKLNSGVIGDPIIMGDAVIREGDLIIADDDGIVVWPQNEVEQLLVVAEKKLNSDNTRLERLLQGKK